MFYIVSPIDEMLMSKQTIEEAREAAKRYIGQEDSYGDDITAVVIFRLEKVETVRG